MTIGIKSLFWFANLGWISILIGAVIISYINYKFWPYISYRSGASYFENVIKMRYHIIRDIWAVNPYKWDFNCCNYARFEETWSRLITYTYGNNNKVIVIPSFIAYNILMYKRKKRERKQNKIDTTIRKAKLIEAVMKSAQKDIDKVAREAIDNIDKARQITEKVANNLRDGMK